MNTATAAALATDAGALHSPLIAPRIGAIWPEMGGIYVGTSAGENGEPDAYLIFAQAQPAQNFTWQAGLDHAKACREADFDDWRVASRWEQPILYAHLHDRIPSKWYWSSTQDAGYSDWAWDQYFGYGGQSYNRKSYEAPVLLVRRVPIR
jgi:hypothetical protein